MTSAKKPKATPNPNPCGLSAREIEIAALAWKCLDTDINDIKINNQMLAKLTGIPLADSAGRTWRTVKAKIIAATVASDTAGPSTPATPATPDGGASAADPTSPSLAASKNKKAAAGGKVAGRKRTMKEADGGDGGDGDKDEAEGGERPKKAAKRVKASRVVTPKEEANAGAGEMDAGEV